MVEGGRFNVVDGRISWQTVRPKTQGSQPRMAILEVAVEYGLNWHLKGKNTPYSTATYGVGGIIGALHLHKLNAYEARAVRVRVVPPHK